MEEEQSTDIPLGEMMCLREEGVGKGKKLVFPNMSSCAAFILVLDDDLIGIHKTTSTNNDLINFQVERATKSISNNQKEDLKLYVAGWGLNDPVKFHDVKAVAQCISEKLNLEAGALPIYVSDFGKLGSKCKEWCLFAEVKSGKVEVGVRPNDKVYCSSENQFANIRNDKEELDKLRETKNSRGEKIKFAARALSYEEEISTTIETTEECNFQEFETQATTKSVSIATEDAVHYWC